MTQLQLRSWFLEPIPQNASRWTKVRVWGLPTSTNTRKWWRSSSIRTRISANHLETRYGSSVRLHGPICKRYASALRMPEHTIRSFANGFPTKWQQLLIEPIGGPRRSGRLAAVNDKVLGGSDDDDICREQGAPRKSVNATPAGRPKPPAKRSSRSSSASRATRSRRRNSETSRVPKKVVKPSKPSRPKKPALKPAKTVLKSVKPSLKSSERSIKFSEPEQGAKRASRKRVAFADIKQSKPGVRSPPPIVSTPAKLASAETWSQDQKDAFEQRRNTVPADDPDYWTLVASGVEGKTTEDCLALWQSSWASPAAKAKKKVGWAKPPKSPKISTPEVVMHVRKAVTRKRSRNTGKYRSGVRRLADTIARETSDDLLEPKIVTPRLDGLSLRDGVGKVLAVGTDGTPGTEVRRKREKADQDGELATPEILARGRTFGLQEADKYVSLFKRRLGTCVIPSLKKKEDESKTVAKGAKVSKPKFVQTTLLPMTSLDSDDESGNSEESDLFF